MSPLYAILLSGGAGRESFMRPVQAMPATLPATDTGGGPVSCTPSTAAMDLLYAELAAGADVLHLVALVACLFCEAASNTLEIVTGRLIAPFRHSVRGRHPASTACPSTLVRSLRQWLCSPSRNEKNCRLSRFIQVSHNPPPLTTSLHTYGCV